MDAMKEQEVNNDGVLRLEMGDGDGEASILGGVLARFNDGQKMANLVLCWFAVLRSV